MYNLRRSEVTTRNDDKTAVREKLAAVFAFKIKCKFGGGVTGNLRITGKNLNIQILTNHLFDTNES